MLSPLQRGSNTSTARKQLAISSIIRRFLRRKAFDALWIGCERSTKFPNEVRSLSHPLEGKSVLVTGGAGAIGTNLLQSLDECQVETSTILDNLSSAYEWNVPKGPRIRFVRGDVLDEAKLEEVFADRPKVVYHLAAHFANQNSVDHPELDLLVNGMGILKVLE